MKCFDKSVISVNVGLALTVVALSACGKKDSSSDNPTTTSPLGDIKIEGLASIPDLSLMLKSNASAKSTALNLARNSSNAVNGTPPAMKELKPSNLEEYFTGSVEAFIAGVEAKKAAAQTANTKEAWDSLQADVSKFRDAQSKCRVIQDTARQVSELSDNSNTMCFFSKIGTKGAGVLSYVSGAKVAEEDFFKPDPDKAVVRKVTMGGGGAKLNLDGNGGGNTEGGGNEGGDKKDGGGQLIVFEYPKADGNNYKVTMTMCALDGSSVRSIETIEVNAEKGTLTLTGLRNEGSNSGSSKVTSALVKGTDGKLTFDFNKERKFEFNNRFSQSNNSGYNSAALTITGETLISELFNLGTSTFEGQTNTFSSKMIAATRFTGSKMSDVRVFEGAGKMFFKGSNGSGQKFENEQSIKFEFVETKSPKFNTLEGTSEFLKLVEARYLNKDKAGNTIAGDTPKQADLAPLSNTAVCGKTATSTYALGATPASIAGFKKVQTTCEGNRGFERGNRDLCQNLGNLERKVMDAVFARQASNK
jgi:hypothetical protein